MPAEWEQQSCIQLTWPHMHTDWAPVLPKIEHTFIEMAKCIVAHEDLVIVTPEPAKIAELLYDYLPPREQSHIHVVAIDTNDTWARDHGAITLVANEKNRTQVPIHLLDFKFNGWGEKFEWQLDNAINSKLDASGVFKAGMCNHKDFVLEGGSIECDGKGTLLTTSQCLLAPHRNQPLTRQDIEDRLLTWLEADRVLWLDHGHIEGDDTDGHIDTLARFAPDNTILYCKENDKNDVNYAELHKMEEQLHTFTTASGAPYNLVALPMPKPVMYDGERLPATYANFVVLNGAVMVPTYNQPETDQKAMQIIGGCFPDREVVGIDASTAIIQHGSLHCLTMQYYKGALAEQDDNL